MKYLSLQQAMLGMRVVLTDTGVLLKSPAGSAEYNHKGRRIKVHGHADYFPDHLRVKDKRSPKGGYLQMSPYNAIVYSADGAVRLRIGRFDKTPVQSDERLMNCNDVSEPFPVKNGQVFIKDTAIPKAQLSRTETDPRKGYAINVGIGQEIKTSVKLSPEMEKAITEVVSTELKKNLQPGGTIWTSLRRGF